MEIIGPTDISQYRDQYREAVEAVDRGQGGGPGAARDEVPAVPRGVSST